MCKDSKFFVKLAAEYGVSSLQALDHRVILRMVKGLSIKALLLKIIPFLFIHKLQDTAKKVVIQSFFLVLLLIL